jgi:hypothetical protein
MVVSSSNNSFLFLFPNFTNGEHCINFIESSGFFPMAKSWFLVHSVKSRLDFSMRKPFLWFVLSFLINYAATSPFCLVSKIINRHRNHHNYPIRTALIWLNLFQCVLVHALYLSVSLCMCCYSQTSSVLLHYFWNLGCSDRLYLIGKRAHSISRFSSSLS